MKGNELKNPQKVELLLRRKHGCERFDEIIIGDRELVKKYFEELKEVLAVSLYSDRKNVCKKKVSNKKLEIYKKVKMPCCFESNAYSEKLKRIKLKNRR